MPMNFGDSVVNFLTHLEPYPNVPEGVGVLNPYTSNEARRVIKEFYSKFYGDSHPRTMLIGINPGRFGAGVTGIGFTDPIRLEEICGIENPFERKAELSSKFIYEMIEGFGGPNEFYRSFYFSSVSPLGFVMDGKNLNYYDIRELQESWETYMVASLRKQIDFGVNPDVAFALGQGQNFKYLEKLNRKHKIFNQIKPLPHPRWVMQYRLKRKQEFVSLYCDELGSIIS